MLAERIQSPLRISEGKNPNETVIVKKNWKSSASLTLGVFRSMRN
jgi:hypothetical protein